MAKNSNEYDRNYYRDVRGPKTAASKAVAAAICPICGDEWAATHAGYNAEIFVCHTCSAKLSKWGGEKEMARRQMEAACQVCYVDPAITIHESSQLRCCLTCSAWLSEGEAEGSQRWKPANADPWDTDGKLGHLFEKGTQFHEPPAVASLCGVKAPVWPIAMDMTTPSALRRFGLCVACFQACPDPAHLFHPRHAYRAYVVPTDVLGRMNVAVGTS